MQILVGAVFLVAVGAAFWIALPRDGKVRSFLRNDEVQAYYTVAMIATLVVSVLNIVFGLVAVVG
jgi:hypothetical protein